MSDTFIIEKRVVLGTDDVEQSATGSMSLTSSDLELTRREFAEAVIAIAEIVRVIGKAVGIAPGPTG
jgi:hypothetical protein